MTSTDTLLPCPFCGGAAEMRGGGMINCQRCGAEAFGPKWQRRTPPTPAADANPFVGTNWQVRADTPTPATEEREAVAQWCSGCHEVRSVDCYRAGCPKSDTERRAAEILAAEAVARALCIAGEEDDFNYKGYLELADAALSTLAQIRAAEILAAEANVTARIVAWLRATSTGLDLTKRRIADAIERGEHGAGK